MVPNTPKKVTTFNNRKLLIPNSNLLSNMLILILWITINVVLRLKISNYLAMQCLIIRIPLAAFCLTPKEPEIFSVQLKFPFVPTESDNLLEKSRLNVSLSITPWFKMNRRNPLRPNSTKFLQKKLPTENSRDGVTTTVSPIMFSEKPLLSFSTLINKSVFHLEPLLMLRLF